MIISDATTWSITYNRNSGDSICVICDRNIFIIQATGWLLHDFIKWLTITALVGFFWKLTISPVLVLGHSTNMSFRPSNCQKYFRQGKGES